MGGRVWRRTVFFGVGAPGHRVPVMHGIDKQGRKRKQGPSARRMCPAWLTRRDQHGYSDRRMVGSWPICAFGCLNFPFMGVWSFPGAKRRTQVKVKRKQLRLSQRHNSEAIRTWLGRVGSLKQPLEGRWRRDARGCSVSSSKAVRLTDVHVLEQQGCGIFLH